MTLCIGFDADDTLWHNESHFQEAHRAFEELLSPWADATTVDDRLFEVETANLPRFGYGVKSFTLSMIETAIDVSGGRADAAVISGITELGKAILDRAVELLEGVPETLDALGHHELVVITKGDLHHQLAKADASGIRHHFSHVEVVAEKDPATYAAVLTRLGIPVERFVMVGNSLRSDVLPVIELGARAVHVPHEVTWRHEAAHDHEGHEVPTLERIRELPDLVSAWDGA